MSEGGQESKCRMATGGDGFYAVALRFAYIYGSESMRETASLLRRANALNGPIYHPSPTLIRPGLDNRETGISPPPVHFPPRTLLSTAHGSWPISAHYAALNFSPLWVPDYRRW